MLDRDGISGSLRSMLVLRSLAFNTLFYANLILWLIFAVLPAMLLPRRVLLAVAIGWAHSSLWMYNAVGAAGGEGDDSLANFYFGAFRNNYVDKGDPKRYREFDSFPGFEIDELGGRRFAKSVLEWNLPPIRFKRVGSPGFYLSWIRPALFGGRAGQQSQQRRARRAHPKPDQAIGGPLCESGNEVLGRAGKHRY